MNPAPQDWCIQNGACIQATRTRAVTTYDGVAVKNTPRQGRKDRSFAGEASSIRCKSRAANLAKTRLDGKP